MQKRTEFLFTLNYLPLHPDFASICHLQYGLLQPEVPPTEQYAITPHDRENLTQRPLRVGFLSGDFWQHAVAFFLLPLLRHRQRDKLHVTLFSCQNHLTDDYTRRLKDVADVWVQASLSTSMLASQIDAAKLDVLFDLAGHTSYSRLDVMSRHAAPLQATWLGYPNTTGLRDVHYRLTDSIADPYDTMQVFAERLVRMSGPFLCYEIPAELFPPVSPCPAANNGFITFGSLSNHNLAKINNVVLQCWARILAAVPNSRLVIKARQFLYGGLTQQYLTVLQSFGISSSRVLLLPSTKTPAEYLALYSQIDIALDTFPYNGTTTTCEALCMGVPMIVLRGEHTHVERVGTSLLTHAGLDWFIASDLDDYVSIAVELAGDPTRLTQHRANLRAQVQASPLCDGPAFAREFTGIWRRIFTNWQAGDGSPPLPDDLVDEE